MTARNNRAVRYVFALAAVGAGAVARALMNAVVGPGLPTYITFYPGVMVVALVGGVGPGLLATAATALLVDIWLLPPYGTIGIDNAVDVIGLLFFSGMGAFMTLVAGRYIQIRDSLEERVAARTKELDDSNALLKQQVALIDPARAEVIVAEMERVLRSRRDAVTSPAAPSSDALRVVPSLAGAAVISIGLLVLLGWAFNLETLKSVLPGLASMKANTALCFALLGSALLLRDRRWIRLGLTMIVLAISLLTSAEYLFGVNYGIDGLLFFDPGNPQTLYPGRMVPATAGAFLLLSFGLLLHDVRKREGVWAQETAAVSAGLLGMTAALGYIYDIRQLYGFSSLASMAAHTSLGLIILATGLIFARRDGLARVLIEPGPGTQMARRLLPVAILLPIVFAWLHEIGERTGVFSSPVGAALFAIVMMLSFVSIIWFVASALNSADLGRKETEVQLRNRVELMDHSREALIIRELDGAIRFWNRGAASLYGWSAAEAMGQRVHVLLKTGGLPEDNQEVLEKTGHWDGELVHTTKGDKRVFVESSMTAIRADDGHTLVLKSDRDITERKQAEEALRQSEERYRNLFNSLIEGFCIIEMIFDAEGKPVDYRFLEINSTFEEQTGLHDAQGKTMRELSPEHEEHWFGIYGKIALTGEPARFENEARALNRWFDVRAFRVGGQDSRKVAIAFSDITERKRAETVIVDATVQKRAAQYSRSLLEASLDPLVTISSDGKITDVNEAAIKATGISRQGLIGTDFSDYFTEPEKARRGYQQVFAEGFVTDYPLTIRHKGGKLTDVLYNASVYRDARGNVLGVFAAARDITLQKKAENELKRNRDNLELLVKERTSQLEEANKDLVKSNENLEQFAYVASHDLQEPLRVMSNFSQLLEKRYKGQMDKDADEFIGFIVDAAGRMQKLIIDLLAYSRAGHKGAETSSVDCNMVLDRLVEGMGKTIESVGGTVTHDMLPIITANESSIGQLFQNLIGNALKFRGEEPPKIHIGAKKEGDFWLFSVADNGIGIEKQYHEKIFMIFQRLHPRDRYTGTGIGLSICKKIVENLGGRIWVESQPGKGSTFYFTIRMGGVKND
jgi:PAS domain S-box-containing protein